MKDFRIEQRLMGSQFTLGIVHHEDAFAQKLLQKGIEEIKRIEQLLSEFLSESDTSKINREAEKRNVSINKETFDLITRCQHISQLTKGSFDITVSPLKRIYSFKNEEFLMPETQLIESTLAKVGYNFLELNEAEHTIKFTKPGMRISFAAIGKGYASDMVKKLWVKDGVTSGYINASGDLNAFGQNAEGYPWKIGIADPDNKSEILLKIPVSNASVATSGDYEQHFMHNGVRYSHNIDPMTGKPISGIKSVTVFSPAAELSDALATAVYVKGVKEGIHFVNQLPQTHAIIIDEKNKIHFSNDLQYERI